MKQEKGWKMEAYEHERELANQKCRHGNGIRNKKKTKEARKGSNKKDKLQKWQIWWNSAKSKIWMVVKKQEWLKWDFDTCVIEQKHVKMEENHEEKRLSKWLWIQHKEISN